MKTYKDVVKQYIKRFGKEPEFINNLWQDEEEKAEKLLKAIKEGKEYKETPLKKGAII